MNNLPLYFILSYAFKVLQDAELASFRKDYRLANAWIDQSVGITRMIEDYSSSGGVLSTAEQDSLERLRRFQNKLTETIPAEPENAKN